jgi:hypothetical protein
VLFNVGDRVMETVCSLGDGNGPDPLQGWQPMSRSLLDTDIDTLAPLMSSGLYRNLWFLPGAQSHHNGPGFKL